jgi:hypothetical protein
MKLTIGFLILVSGFCAGIAVLLLTGETPKAGAVPIAMSVGSGLAAIVLAILENK